MKSFDYIILGAGIMGLETARLLSKEGAKVALIDIQKPAREASWAAAGILVSRGSKRIISKSRNMYCNSIAHWPSWVKQLENLSEQAIDIQTSGDICVMFDEQVASRFAGRLRSEQAEPFEELNACPEWVSKQHQKDPLKVYHFPDEKYANNRMVLDALLKIIWSDSNIECTFETNDFEWSQKYGTHKLLLPIGEKILAKNLSICSGAWSGKFLEPMNYKLSLKPVRGQVYQIDRWYTAPEMIHIDDQYYLVPRGDSLLVGGTSESDIWEQGNTDAARVELETAFKRLIPDFEIPKHAMSWSGIRPKTDDAKPIIGFLQEDPSISMNFGHYRTGISLAPLCCSEYVAGLCKGEMPETLGDFDPHRPQGLQLK